MIIINSGSHAQIKFSPGDYMNSTFGPFNLDMNFAKNASEIPLEYQYKVLGNYSAKFQITNALGTKSFTCPLTVMKGLYGIFLHVSPGAIRVGSGVTASVFLVYGDGVKYQWLLDGQWIGDDERICN